METYEKPSYFAVIPANVRYDKRLKANEKLMYSEILSLTNQMGECMASNKYFANLYDVTSQAVSKWLLHLQELGYITIEYIYKNKSKEIEKRIIKGVSTNVDRYQQMFKENNIRESINNNYIDNTLKIEEKEKEIYKEKERESDLIIEFETIWANYPKKVGKAKAIKSFIKARKNGAKYDDIIKGLESYNKQIQVLNTKRQFIKDGSTWFGNHCWDDEYQIKKDTSNEFLTNLQKVVNEMEQKNGKY